MSINKELKRLTGIQYALGHEMDREFKWNYQFVTVWISQLTLKKVNGLIVGFLYPNFTALGVYYSNDK